MGDAHVAYILDIMVELPPAMRQHALTHGVATLSLGLPTAEAAQALGATILAQCWNPARMRITDEDDGPDDYEPVADSEPATVTPLHPQGPKPAA
jgi:hypothetical protein